MSNYTTRRRLFVRRNGGTETPFIPWGLLPVLGLGAVLLFGLIPFAASWVQDNARISAEKALSAIDADWASVEASGQWITLKGQAPDAAAIKTAERAIYDANARTFFGFKAGPVTEVNNKATLAAAPVPKAEPVITATPHEWTYTLDRSILDINGEVPDQEMRNLLLDAASRRKSPPQFTAIRDNLTVTGRVASEGYKETALRGINAISRCHAGKASFLENTFSLNCEAPEAIAREIEVFSSVPLPFGEIGRIDVFSPEEAEACDQSLITLLSTARIEFATSSAVINEASASLLNQITSAAKICPGTLRIEGHTDNSGRASLNDRLSTRRAEAVRRALIDRGIAAGRLTAVGFGADRPIADNGNENGRARNRRIEIKVARGDE